MANFDPAKLDEFLNGISDEDRATARDLLSDPKKIGNYITAHKKANNEAMVSRQSMKALMKATGVELTSEEQQEVASHIDNIFPDGEFDPDAWTDVLNEFGAVDLVNSGEMTPEELGLIQDPETGEMSVDLDDGETYLDDNGDLVDGNGYYVDDDGNHTDSPMNIEDVEKGGSQRFHNEQLKKLEQRQAELDQREQAMALEQKLIRHGVDPESVSDFAKIYPAFKTDDGSEATSEQMTQHFQALKSNPKYGGFFSNNIGQSILPSGGRMGVSGDANAETYARAKASGNIQEMLKVNKKYSVTDNQGNDVPVIPTEQ